MNLQTDAVLAQLPEKEVYFECPNTGSFGWLGLSVHGTYESMESTPFRKC
ncbi:MAG TPA: hypothetical protein VFU57_06585 [Candidatus Acidoferrales bacterium]|nr:hypothetical protein [Candidatus Acidoferrales bacterium]